jgi:hypothetical protein
MRAIAGLFFTILFVGVLIAIGNGIYSAGVAQGIVDAGRVPAGAAVGMAGYGYGWGFHGFGFLGLLFPLLFLFILFGIIRAIFGFGGRGRGWSHHHAGDSRGWDGKGGYGHESWREERERRMAELHKRLHDEEAAGGSTAHPSGTTGSTGSTPG